MNLEKRKILVAKIGSTYQTNGWLKLYPYTELRTNIMSFNFFF